MREIVSPLSGIRSPFGVRRAGGGGGAPAPLDFIWYGQSNNLFHTTITTDQPAASADTLLWDRNTDQWITPTGNGMRNFLNAMQAATGRVCRAVYGGLVGANISSLQKGDASGAYEALLSDVFLSGINPAFIIWHQGEGDANTALPSINAYRSALDTLHGTIVGDIGRTRAQVPLICSSLGTVVTSGAFAQPDSSWQTIQDALVGVNTTLPNAHYSHSNMDAVRVDDVHWTGASYGRSGQRYARTVQVLMGLQTSRPRLFATAAERVSGTRTRIRIAHDMGTDFTPSSGITGFELSNDNGANWVVGTGSREDADDILVDHIELGASERLIRYQYGKLPNVSVPLKDNSSLAVPLNFTSTNLVAAGAVALPSITYASTTNSGVSTTPQTFTGVAVPGGSEAILAILGITAIGIITPNSCSVTAQPSGTIITATLVVRDTDGSNSTSAAIYQAELPSGTTSIDVTVGFPSNPFANSRLHVSTVPVARLSSTTATGTGVALIASGTTAATTVNVSADGVVFAIAAKATFSNTGSTITGGGTFSTRVSNSFGGGHHMAADASGVAASATSAVSANFANTAGNAIVVAAAWR